MDRAIPSARQSFIPPADPAAPLAIGDELMTVNDAARFLRVTVSWVYEHTRDDAEDRLPFAKIGPIEAHVLAELHERQAVLGVIARVLVDPRHRHVEEACGVVDRQQFVAETGDADGSGRFSGSWRFDGRKCSIHGVPVCRCGHLVFGAMTEP